MTEIKGNQFWDTVGQGSSGVGVVSRRAWLVIGFVAITSGFGAVAADVASGWSAIPNSTMETTLSLRVEDVAPVLRVKSDRSLLWGHYLALLFVPFGILGIWFISVLLGPAGRKWSVSFLVLGTLTYAIGTAYHISYGFVATVIQHDNEALTQKIAPFFEPFGTILIVALVVSMMPLIGGILTGRTVYPRWTVALTPIPLQFGLSAVAQLFPASVENLIIVTGINASMTLFLALSMGIAIQKGRVDSERSPLKNT